MCRALRRHRQERIQVEKAQNFSRAGSYHQPGARFRGRRAAALTLHRAAVYYGSLTCRLPDTAAELVDGRVPPGRDREAGSALREQPRGPGVHAPGRGVQEGRRAGPCARDPGTRAGTTRRLCERARRARPGPHGPGRNGIGAGRVSPGARAGPPQPHRAPFAG